MKHIRLFEDYSDEELRDLQVDLEGIGHDYKLLQKGKDFGYGTAFHDGASQGYPLYFTKGAVKKLEDKGIIVKVNAHYVFTDNRINKRLNPITPFGNNLFRIAYSNYNSKSKYLQTEKYLSDLKA
jgi:hypothetical protein